MASKLSRDFFRQPTLEVAPALLGRTFVSTKNGKRMSGRIVEVEAYIGEDDPASHARFGPTGRNSIMYGDGGHIYVYFIYGMYHMLNFVTEPKGTPAAVLIRALEPLEGIPDMVRNRGTDSIRSLCSGPGKLCDAFGVTLEDTGKSLSGREYFVLEESLAGGKIASGPRIGIGQGHDLMWRFYDSESKFVSRK
jgi:DNA-3-methyladenine glycosylase